MTLPQKQSKKVLIQKNIIKILIPFTGNKIVQKILEKNVNLAQYLRGIGAGSSTLSSGEKKVIKIFNKKTIPPLCFFDVGANKGQFVKLIKNNIKTDNFCIHCFEPAESTFKELLNIKHDDKRIIINNIGLGKETGEKMIYYDKPGSGLASLTKRDLRHFDKEFGYNEKVKIETLDNYCISKNIEKIDLLKIDVEGHELDVLKGASKMLGKNMINIITFEFGGCNIDTKTFFKEFVDFFEKYDMKIHRITPSGYFCPIKKYKEDQEQFKTTNFIAFKNFYE